MNYSLSYFTEVNARLEHMHKITGTLSEAQAAVEGAADRRDRLLWPPIELSN